MNNNRMKHSIKVLQRRIEAFKVDAEYEEKEIKHSKDLYENAMLKLKASKKLIEECEEEMRILKNE